MTRVYCVDDHELILDGLCSDLAKAEDFVVVGQSTDPKQALEEILDRRDEIDVVITDIDMPHMSGFDLCEEIKRHGALPRVVYLTYHVSDEIRYKALRSKMDGITFKSASTDSIISFIDEVCKGENIIVRALPTHVKLIQQSNELTATERTVTRLLACEGLTNSEAAERLHRSKDTVETHRKNIMSKLGLKNTVELVHFAIRSGICNLNPDTTD
ncbi:MAG: response regulator transcription factor [Candidatus Kapabacteria bacterium]|nr:response regulator transcription factor [Candidatus Kapabacteria bacterium]